MSNSSKTVLKTSEEWVNDPTYLGLTILDPDGWPREPREFQYHWFEELIDKSEFDRRMLDSTIKWSFSKL